MLPLLYLSSNIDEVLNANTDNNDNGVQFDLYDKIYDKVIERGGEFSYETSTVVDNRDDKVKILADNIFDSSPRTYSDAIERVSIMSSPSYQTAYNRFINRNNSFFSIPTMQDLELVTNQGQLSEQIPKINTGWWLGGEPLNNRVKYVTKDNRFNGSGRVLFAPSISIENNSKQCSKETIGVTEPGTLLYEDIISNSATAQVYESKKIHATISVTNATTAWDKSEQYTQADCKGTTLSTKGVTVNRNGTPYLSYSASSTPNWTFGIGGTGGARADLYLDIASNKMGLDKFFALQSGQTVTLQFKKGECMNLNKVTHPSNIKSYKIAADGDLTINVSKVENEKKVDVSCEPIVNNADVNYIRILKTFSSSDILFKNINKRDLSIATGHFDQDFPTSDDFTGIDVPAYVTFKDVGMSLELQEQENINTSTNTIKTEVPSNNIIEIPLAPFPKGNGSDKQVITASAVMNGKKKYGILKAVGNDCSSVSINLLDFTDNPSSLGSLKVSLYVEEYDRVGDAFTGGKAYNFMSDPLDVTILLDPPKATQSISFDPDLPTTATYGEPFTITSRLSSDDIDTQSAYDLLFNIDSGNARITEQSYDSNTGIASAKVLPTGGSGDVTVSISKKGDDNADDAVTQTYTFGLIKKDITIQPKLPDKVYAINDTMPSFTSISSDLINSDQIPSVIVPILENIDTSGPALPNDGNKIVNLGTWKLVYPANILDSIPASEQSFLSNYNITLKDYTQDPSFVFETTIGTIPDDWIVITPSQPNEHGWYNTTVTIAPSIDAIANGYDTIEAVNNGMSGNSITYDSSLVVTPEVLLKKGSISSKSKKLNEIKIDKESPVASVNVVNENEWTDRKKAVHITVSEETISKIASVVVKRSGNDVPYTITQSNNVYSFVADQDGDYTITITNYAGNAIQIEKTISKIDTGTVDISAELVDFPNPSIKLSQDITITTNAGASGIQAINAYYKKNASDSFTLLRALDDPEATMTFTAEMNGIYQFELVTNAGVKKTTTELTVEGLNPPLPCTKFTATYKNDTTKTYTSGTWTNDEIILDVSNTNSEIEEAGLTPVWEISKDGRTWEVWSGPKTFITSETIQVRAKVEILGQTYYETTVKKVYREARSNTS